MQQHKMVVTERKERKAMTEIKILSKTKTINKTHNVFLVKMQ